MSSLEEDGPQPTDRRIYSPLCDDPDIAPIVEIFVQSLPERLTAIHLAIGSGTRSEVIRLAHQLKGSASAFGYGELAGPAASLETEAKDSQDFKTLASYADQLTHLARLITTKPTP